MRLWFPVFIAIISGTAPALAGTHVENGVRVHRMDTSRAGPVTAAPISSWTSPVVIALDRTYGAAPSCASMDWRLSVPREMWEARCGKSDYTRWYDRWVYRGY